MKKIPLRRKDGSIRAWAVVDDCDFEWASKLRWCLLNGCYVARGKQKNGKRFAILLHREIAQRAGMDTSQTIDHVNRDRLDNRRANLRPASKAEQMQNKSKRINNTSGFVGVNFHKRNQEWQAQIQINGKKKHIGYFNTALDAGAVAAIFRLEHHGEFAAHVGEVTDLTEELVK